jgi:hypothetical protein
MMLMVNVFIFEQSGGTFYILEVAALSYQRTIFREIVHLAVLH